ncbi:Mg2+ transporter like zinc transport [Fusarium mexicanum]|uniref:Mg2+ transporter like zinc transport n=1 Tax=Fusarium mexicanum TaxID=751941 RepID=A0A8H5JJN7_9HYPO|nr:Mg2+ transporter like zinc transport [Fusarium mexicanum]
MVHDLLLDYSPSDRDKILIRLRRVQRRQEIKSPQGPNLRPVFVPLYDEDQKPDFGLASILDGVRSPCVEEVWCLAFDSKNLITVSWLEADSIWPILSPGTQYSEPWAEVPRMAISEYFQNNRNLPQERYADLASSKQGLVVVDLMVFFGIVGQTLSAVVPGGWMLDQLFRKVEKYVFGIDSSDIIRIVLGFSPGRYDGEPLRNLSALDKHMQHWIEVERTTWGQAEAYEEVAQAIRDLWLIAFRFTMNFHLSPDREAFQVDRERNRPETLQDLEDELAAAIANLNRHPGAAQSELQATRDDENKDMSRSIQSFGNNLSLACLFRMCTILTPTRLSITSQDITDILAGRITRLEWLVRGSVSQSQVYQISALSDELRILKEILHSQMQVVSQIAQSLAKATASSTSAKAGKLRHRKLAYDIENLQDTTERLKSQAALFIKIKAEDQSVAIYLFTFVTVVFLPLSFATNYMGMNTSDIRDMKQGQWIFWAVGGGAKMEESEADSEAFAYGPNLKRR